MKLSRLPGPKAVCHIRVMDTPGAQPKGPPIDADPRLDGAALAALRKRGISDAEIRRALASLRPVEPKPRNAQAD